MVVEFSPSKPLVNIGITHMTVKLHQLDELVSMVHEYVDRYGSDEDVTIIVENDVFDLVCVAFVNRLIDWDIQKRPNMLVMCDFNLCEKIVVSKKDIHWVLYSVQRTQNTHAASNIVYLTIIHDNNNDETHTPNSNSQTT